MAPEYSPQDSINSRDEIEEFLSGRIDALLQAHDLIAEEPLIREPKENIKNRVLTELTKLRGEEREFDDYFGPDKCPECGRTLIKGEYCDEHGIQEEPRYTGKSPEDSANESGE